MVAQTRSPFETLARVIEHFDADGRSVRRTEAAERGDGEPLRATLEVSIPGGGPDGPAGFEAVDASIDDGLSVTYRVPSFPDPSESLPPEHPGVSVAATGIGTDGEDVVVTVGVTIDADRAAAADARAGGSAAATGREAATFGTGGTDAAHDDTTADGEATHTEEPGTSAAADDGPSGEDAGDAETSLASVRDESVPPYDDTPYLRRLYETCETFDEMSRRIEMDVSAETVRRYTIEAGVHSPTSYETAGESREESDGDAAGAPESGASDDDPAGTATDSRGGATTGAGGGVEPSSGDDARRGGPLPDEQLVADGIGLPEELTLHEVVDAVVDARTVHEVQRDVGLGYDRTRQLLTQLNVLDLVVGRVGAEPDREGTVEIVADRIRQCTSDSA